MSTSSTMSSVSHHVHDSPGHGHGRRGHGHSRSNRWTPVPSSLSLSSTEQHSQQNAKSATSSGHTGHSNGHIPEGSQPINDHPHSHSYHHTESHVPYSTSSLNGFLGNNAASGHGDALGDDQHGFSAQSQMSFEPSENESSRTEEIVAGILTTLPWVLLSWYWGQYTESTSLKGGDWLEPSASEPNLPHSGDLKRGGFGVEQLSALMSVTMLLTGLWQISRRENAGLSGTVSAIHLPSLNAVALKTACLRIFSLALPVYAAMKIGAVMVALSLLLTFASGLPSITEQGGSLNSSKEGFSRKKLTLALLLTFVVLSVLGLDAPMDRAPFRGYLALFVSIFLIRPPFPAACRTAESASESENVSPSKVLDTGAYGPNGHGSGTLVSPLIASSDDTMLTVLSGGLLAVLALVLIVRESSSFPISDILWVLLTSSAFAASLVSVAPSGLRTPQKLGMAAGSIFAVLLGALPHSESSLVAYSTWVLLAGFSYVAARFDGGRLHSASHSHAHHHHHHHHHSDADPSKISRLLIQYAEPYSLLHSILKERDSRRIFYFMTLNFAFMLVQLSYGFITGSLGLLSDSIHMFFDCIALVVGLCAAVMSKWPPSARFPYGYGKVDTLSGFANAVFLMIISVEIVYEAVERLLSGSEMHRLGELLLVSAAGLGVNLVGIMAFDHAHHGHSHGGHDHDHSHANENMHGIFLHILADTLGSVAVVISTILVHFYGWPGFDPIASCLIAILIFASAVPLVSSTAKTLLLTLPADVEYNLRDTLAGVSTLRGVAGYTAPKFWLDDTGATSDGHSHDHHGHSHSPDHGHDHCDQGHHNHDHDHSHNHDSRDPQVLGVIHVIASRGADLDDVRQRTINFLREKNMDIIVQVEREGDGRCWCGGGNKSP